MTLRAQEERLLEPLFFEQDKIGVGYLALSRGASDPQTLDDLKTIRAEFVKAMGWFDDIRDDTDRYDDLPETFHFAVRDRETAHIIAGMRLTAVSSVEDSLSWSMLEKNQTMQRDALARQDEYGEPLLQELNQAAAGGNLWDLTRLVNPLDGSVRGDAIVGALVELIGVGIAMTSQHGSEEQLHNLRWIFTTTPALKQALDHLGILNTVLAQGRVSPGDKEDAYFCVASPLDALRHVYEHPETFSYTVQHVTDGLKKANAL